MIGYTGIFDVFCLASMFVDRLFTYKKTEKYKNCKDNGFYI